MGPMGSGSVSALRSGVLLGPTGPKDVDGGVGVGVGLMSACFALEHRAAPISRRDVAAVGTGSAGVAGIYRDDCPTGAFSLVGDHREQGSPPGVTDTTVQTRLGRGPVGGIATGAIRSGLGAADQVRDDQVLVDEQVIVIHEAPRELMQRVGATVPDPAVHRRVRN